VACEPDARVETGPADGELELQMRGMGHAPPSQSSQPSVGARSAAKASPVSIETRVIRPRSGARSRTRKVSVAASAPSRDAAGAHLWQDDLAAVAVDLLVSQAHFADSSGSITRSRSSRSARP